MFITLHTTACSNCKLLITEYNNETFTAKQLTKELIIGQSFKDPRSTDQIAQCSRECSHENTNYNKRLPKIYLLHVDVVVDQ